MKSKNWEKRFDEQIYEELLNYGWDALAILIRDFIQKELAQQKAELLKELVKIREEATDDKFGTIDLDTFGVKVLDLIARKS